jgi:hypothetical protein
MLDIAALGLFLPDKRYFIEKKNLSSIGFVFAGLDPFPPPRTLASVVEKTLSAAASVVAEGQYERVSGTALVPRRRLLDSAVAHCPGHPCKPVVARK